MNITHFYMNKNAIFIKFLLKKKTLLIHMFVKLFYFIFIILLDPSYYSSAKTLMTKNYEKFMC